MATYEVKWSRAALDDLERFLVYLLDEVSLREAQGICDRIFQSTLLLEKYPRLYQEVPEYGHGVRRIIKLGRHVLYEVNDDDDRTCRVLAVVGQGQKPRDMFE